MTAIIFDCDGVLVDSEELSCRAWLPVLARRGVPAELPDIEVFIGRSDRDLLEHFRSLTGLALDGDIVAERESEYTAMARRQLQTFPGLPAVLDELVARSTPMAVASSGTPGKIRFSLGHTGLDRYFTVLCSTVEVPRGKPAPDLFLHAASRLGVPPGDCLVVEDSVPGIEGARAAGMKALGFTSSHPAPVLERAGAHALFGQYSDFLAVAASLSGPEDSDK
ncbi:MAG: HAD family phosphatase [Gemmatimonadota bacterium]